MWWWLEEKLAIVNAHPCKGASGQVRLPDQEEKGSATTSKLAGPHADPLKVCHILGYQVSFPCKLPWMELGPLGKQTPAHRHSLAEQKVRRGRDSPDTGWEDLSIGHTRREH